MTIASIGTLGTGASSGNNQASLAMTTQAATEAGNLVVLAVAVDNNQTTDGDSTAVSGVTDSAGGNEWIRAKGFANGQGTVQTGADISIWYSNIKNTIASGGSITATFTTSAQADASAMSAWEFSKASSTDVSIEGTPGGLANDAANAGSLNVTTANISCLRFRAIASESNSTTALTPTAGGWAIITQAVSGAGTSATEMGVRGEFLISTGTSEASAPTGGAGAVDHASAYVAFKEGIFLLTATTLASGASDLGTPTLVRIPNIVSTSIIGSSPFLDTSPPTLEASGGEVNLTGAALASQASVLGQPVLSSGGVDSLIASSLGSQATILGTPTLTLLVDNLTASEFDGDSPIIDEGNPSLGAFAEFTAASIASGTSFVGTPAINQNHALVASSLNTSASTLGAPSLGQAGQIVAESIASQPASLTTPTINQQHILTGLTLTSEVSVLGQPVLAQAGQIVATSLISQPASIGSPVFGQNHVLAASTLASSASAFTSPALIKVLTANSIASVASDLGTPTIKQNHFLTSVDLASSVAALGQPTVSQTGQASLTATGIASQPASIGSPVFGQKHVLTASTLASSASILTSPSLIKILTANSIASAASNLGTPVIKQGHNLAVVGVAAQPASIGSSVIGQRHNLTAVSLASANDSIGVASISLDRNLSANSIATTADVLGSPTIKQGHNLAATNLVSQQSTIGQPAFGQKHILTVQGIFSGAASIGRPILIPPGAIVVDGIASQSANLGWPDLGILAAVSITSQLASIGIPLLFRRYHVIIPIQGEVDQSITLQGAIEPTTNLYGEVS